MNVDTKKEMIEKLSYIETMLPQVVRKAIENGRNPDECFDIYNKITQLLAEVKSEVECANFNLTDEKESTGPKLKK